ncbi:hydantoinase/oxoprolinase family protein [Sinirhodobacter huangdaonensis]|uniref:Hydantoinase/oxoprolinase family protein n=1 Tax=Paenirhodobacter huangdaonensis TaxID=2501515 RepID=A0A3S3MPE2_9RHOB|nr:hydantoinase/oxoprolinase family protein [Sinirhodobacter huangdaonensis]RWR51128.1 hydantoinase/oxoprolinase family protein [Sinirhodobacter huangdaonensis]
MAFTIDIDTGGTFTDGFVSGPGVARAVKTPTTPHDLTECFLACITAGAGAVGLSVEAFLEQTDVVRFASTVGTNALIERNGAKIGLILSEGGRALAPLEAEGKPGIVSPEMAIEIGAGLSPSQVLDRAQALIDAGAQCLVVALDGSETDPARERAVRQVIKAEYPRDFLGSIPVFLSSDITVRSGYGERINSAVVSAYSHSRLARLLYKAEQELRARRYRGPFLIGHNDGAVARVAKTRAISTYNSGPAAGLVGARAIGRLYGENDVISADMGGTSFDIGLVSDGQLNVALRPGIEGYRTNVPMNEVEALGAGGGSIAAVVDGVLVVGPRSAGAMPGPACFGLGGSEPTVTDCNLVLGRIDPDNFLGGARRLDAGKAREAVRQHLAEPLGISLEEAALSVVNQVDSSVGAAIAALRRTAKSDPLLTVYGGAGPLHACRVAEMAGLSRIAITPFSAVFSAFSSSLMDVGHGYMCAVEAEGGTPGLRERVAGLVAGMQATALRDMRGEGFDPDSLSWHLNAILRRKDGSEAQVSVEVADPLAAAALATLHEAIAARVPDAAQFATVGLFASAPVPHFSFAERSLGAPAADAAQTGRRAVICGPGPAAEVPVFDLEQLCPGHALTGPALLESDKTTIWVAPGWQARIDRFANLLLTKG